MQQSNDLLSNDLQITSVTETHLLETAKWGKFLAIVGFIFAVFMAIFAFAVTTFLDTYNTYSASYYSGLRTGITIIYLIMALLIFFPSLFLFRFSVRMQQALRSASQESFESSFQNLKAMFRFWGIIGIISLIFFALGLIGIIMQAA